VALLPPCLTADALTGLTGQFDLQLNPVTRPDTMLLSDQDMASALERASRGEYDRKFVFGRRKGHWVISTFLAAVLHRSCKTCHSRLHW
jgi:hypothetical protein